MTPEDPNLNREKLTAVLREARVTPALPPRFREGVWRRIEESDSAAASRLGWFDTPTAWVMRPRFALAAAAAVVCAGALLGGYQGRLAARQDAQSRYVASVAPNSLR